MKIGATIMLLVALLLVAASAHARSCPSGTHQYGNKCVRCPSGATYVGGGKCQTYRCRPGCTYVGGGKCRCRR
jgi:hypothetical protein